MAIFLPVAWGIRVVGAENLEKVDRPGQQTLVAGFQTPHYKALVNPFDVP